MKLTADLCAQAIVAAARIYGDDPARAITAERGYLRRSLAPAALALSLFTRQDIKVVAAALKISVSNVRTARTNGLHRFWAAHDAALSAIAGAKVQAAATGERHATPTSAAKPAPAPKPQPNIAPNVRLAAIPISAGPSAPQRPAALPPQRNQFNRFRNHAPAKLQAPRAISASDQLIIDAAIAKGAVKVMPAAVAEGTEVLGLKLKAQPEPLEYNRDTHLYSRSKSDPSKGKGW